MFFYSDANEISGLKNSKPVFGIFSEYFHNLEYPVRPGITSLIESIEESGPFLFIATEDHKRPWAGYFPVRFSLLTLRVE